MKTDAIRECIRVTEEVISFGPDNRESLVLAAANGKVELAALEAQIAAKDEALRDLLDAFWDMSPLEYAQSRGLPFMGDEEGEKIKERARTTLSPSTGKVLVDRERLRDTYKTMMAYIGKPPNVYPTFDDWLSELLKEDRC